MLAPLLLALAAGDVQVHWRDAAHPVASLPDDLPARARAAIDLWAPWSAEHELDLWLDDDAGVLLAHAAGDEKQIKKLAKRDDWPPTLVRRSIEEFERLVGAPSAPPETGTDAAHGSAGAETRANEEPEMAVLLQANDMAAYQDAIAAVARQHAYLTPWSATAAKLGGFVLQEPLVASWPSELPKADLWDTSDAEWDSANELVHRLAQLLVLRDFGTQPYWLQVGVGWLVEEEVRGTLYCFPYRDGFVSVHEHDGWDKELRADFKKAEFELAPLAGWKRGTFDPELAQQAWGILRWISTTHPDALAPILDDLRRLRATEGRVTLPDGKWELRPDYEVSPEDQHAVLARRLGEDFEERITAAFRKGLR